MPSVLFVCLGNICRSPLAEGIMRARARERGIDLVVDSAGTGDWHVGEPPCEHSIRVAAMHGIDITGLRARQVEPEDLHRFSHLVGLDDANVADLKRMGARKVLKLGDYGYDGADVPDPYFFPGFEGFEKVYEMIDTCVGNLLAEIAGR
jgi:protein-tyrosine phosphatase